MRYKIEQHTKTVSFIRIIEVSSDTVICATDSMEKAKRICEALEFADEKTGVGFWAIPSNLFK